MQIFLQQMQLLIITFIEDITQWCEDMKFIFKWKKKFMSECISSNQHVIFFYYINMSVLKMKKTSWKTKEKQKNDVSNIFTSEDMENISLELVSRMYSSFVMENTSCLFFGITLISMY